MDDHSDGVGTSIKLHLHFRLNTCLEYIAKNNCKPRRQTFSLGLDASYIKDLIVIQN